MDLRAVAVRVKVDYFTKVRDNTTIDVLGIVRHDPSLMLACGPVRVRTVVFGFRKISEKSHRVIETEDLSLPPWEFRTHGVWMEVDDACKVAHYTVALTSDATGAARLQWV